jgi:hypothetical protein
MKGGDFIAGFERFFLDIVGTILPGLGLLVGFCYITGTPLFDYSKALFSHSTDYEWVFLIALSYVLGHAIASLGFKITRKLEYLYQSDLVRQAIEGDESNWILSFVKPESELVKKLPEDPIYRAFLETLLLQIPALSVDAKKATKPRTWRNMALSIAPEQSQLVYRFTFISLLNLGASTVCICLFLLWGTLLSLKGFHVAVNVINFNFLLILLAILPFLFLERFYNFSGRAFQLPFSMALAKMAEKKGPENPKAPDKQTLQSFSPSSRLKVYLAGGFKSGWQDQVIKALPAYDYLDPRSHGFEEKSEYTAWDLEAVRRSDFIFAYLESTNPGGYALALEVGYAKALGKFVVFVDEKTPADPSVGRYLAMVSETADVSLANIQEGIAFMQRFAHLK